MSIEITAVRRSASLPRRILQRVARFIYDERPGDQPGIYAGIGLALDLRGPATRPKIQLTNQFLRIRRSIRGQIDKYWDLAYPLCLLAFARSGERREVLNNYNRLLRHSQENFKPREHKLNQAMISLAVFLAGDTRRGSALMDEVVLPIRTALRKRTYKPYPDDIDPDPIKIARLLVEMGRPAEALELADEYCSFSEQGRPLYYSDNLGKIALFWAEQGRPAEALELVNKIEVSHRICEVLKATGYALKTLGRDQELAEEILKAKRGLAGGGRVENLGDLLSGAAMILADLGRFEEAREVIQRHEESQGLCQVATRLAQAGRFGEAIEVAEHFGVYGDSFEYELAALGNLASALLKADPKIASPRRVKALKDEAHKLLLEAVETEADLYVQAQELAIIDTRFADKVICEIIIGDGSLAGEFKRVAMDYGLAWSLNEIERIESERRLIEHPRQCLEEIARAIVAKLASALKLKHIPFTSAPSGSSGAFGTISLAPATAMRMDIRLGMDLLPGGGLTIEAGSSPEEARERIQTLNFLVHHEVAHQVQKERSIAAPTICGYLHLDQKRARRQANEILVDKLGFESARKIYIHDEEAPEPNTIEQREAVSIKAFLALCKLIERDHLANVHVLPDETQARLIALLLEMGSKEVATAFIARLFNGQEAAKVVEITRLIDEYRRIFQTVQLDIT